MPDTASVVHSDPEILGGTPVFVGESWAGFKNGALLTQAEAAGFSGQVVHVEA